MLECGRVLASKISSSVLEFVHSASCLASASLASAFTLLRIVLDDALLESCVLRECCKQLRLRSCEPTYVSEHLWVYQIYSHRNAHKAQLNMPQSVRQTVKPSSEKGVWSPQKQPPPEAQQIPPKLCVVCSPASRRAGRSAPPTPGKAISIPALSPQPLRLEKRTLSMPTNTYEYIHTYIHISIYSYIHRRRVSFKFARVLLSSRRGGSAAMWSLTSLPNLGSQGCPLSFFFINNPCAPF